MAIITLHHDIGDRSTLLIVHIGSDGHAGVYPVPWLVSHENVTGKKQTAASGPRISFRYTMPLLH